MGCMMPREETTGLILDQQWILLAIISIFNGINDSIFVKTGVKMQHIDQKSTGHFGFGFKNAIYNFMAETILSFGEGRDGYANGRLPSFYCILGSILIYITMPDKSSNSMRYV